MPNKIFVSFIFCLSLLTVSSLSFAVAPSDVQKPLALVYKGAGSCLDYPPIVGCSMSAALAAEAGGLEYQFVGPDEVLPEDVWLRARVWVQPGGWVPDQVKAMSKTLKARIVKFVREGGGYAGFCAGGFLATEKFGWVYEDKKKKPYLARGLGLLPGNSRYYDKIDYRLTKEKQAEIIPTIWQGVFRQVYWELGPYFNSSTTKGKGVEVISWYPQREDERVMKAMTVRAPAGKGRVYVTAVHPEAPESWREYYDIKDWDGLDQDLATDMILWAAKMKE